MGSRYSNFINRLVIGKEKSEGYARATLPSNRWELFWDIFKSRFGKIFLINLLTMLFFLPLALLFFGRYMFMIAEGATLPFAAGFGVGYGAPINLVGALERIKLSSNLISFLFLPVALMIASVGISGAMYVMRNMVWTEGVFVANDFWRGIKQNIKQVLMISVIYSILLYFCILAISSLRLSIATASSSTVLMYILLVLTYILLAIGSIIMMHMLSMCVTYELSFFKLFKNACIFTIGNLISSLFFIVLGALPFIITMLGGFFTFVGVVLIILFGLSLLMLVWTIYTQRLFDKYVNDKVKGAKKNRGIYKKVKEDATQNYKKIKEQVVINEISMLNSRPIKPITDEDLKLAELPESFSRKDIERLNESRKALYDDNDKYVEEHIHEEKYAKLKEYQQENLIMDKEREKRMEKAKKVLEKRNKKR